MTVTDPAEHLSAALLVQSCGAVYCKAHQSMSSTIPMTAHVASGTVPAAAAAAAKATTPCSLQAACTTPTTESSST
jgi:hypothetical protein